MSDDSTDMLEKWLGPRSPLWPTRPIRDLQAELESALAGESAALEEVARLVKELVLAHRERWDGLDDGPRRSMDDGKVR